jgi:acetyltransferase-like isoleucine patch superfamily enzyme
MIVMTKNHLVEVVGHADFSVGEDIRIQCASVTIDRGTNIGNRFRFEGGRLALGRKVAIGDNVSIYALERFEVGTQNVISNDCAWNCRNYQAADNNYIGSRTVFGNKSNLNARSVFRMGNFCHVGYACYFDLKRQIVFKDNVAIGPQSVFWTHGAGLPPVLGYPESAGEIVCEDFVWLPYHVTVMPGVTIGSNVISASCAVITKSVDPNKFIAGVPAAVKKDFVPRAMTDEDQYGIIRDRMSHFLEYATMMGCSVTQMSPIEAIVEFEGQDHRLYWGMNSAGLSEHRNIPDHIVVGVRKYIDPAWACATLIPDQQIHTCNDRNRRFVGFLTHYLRGDGIDLKEVSRQVEPSR